MAYRSARYGFLPHASKTVLNIGNQDWRGCRVKPKVAPMVAIEDAALPVGKKTGRQKCAKGMALHKPVMTAQSKRRPPLRGPARQNPARRKSGAAPVGMTGGGLGGRRLRCGQHRRGRLQKAGPTRAKNKERGRLPATAGRQKAGACILRLGGETR